MVRMSSISNAVINMIVIAILGPKHGPYLSLPSHNNLFPESKLTCFRATSFPSYPAKYVRVKANSTHHETNHTFKTMLPSEWTHHFHSIPLDVLEMDTLKEEIDALKPNVKKTLMSFQGTDSTKKRILLIYMLVSLGLAHYFEDEIYKTLEKGFEKIEEMMASEDDLYTVSTIFSVFRTYSYYISSDVFKGFKGNNRHFKESLTSDAKGMLSLYEAAHLRTEKDCILDEAMSFTSSHLESLAADGTCQPHLSNRIRSALHLAQHWNLEMLFAVEYIPFYEQEKDHDKMLLKFAKLNFKLIQLLYVQELKTVTKWYKEVGLSSKLPPYYRDRIVENHFFSQGVFFEPKLSHARIMLVQYLTLLVIQDDTLDRYASLSEAETLVNRLERWAPDHTMDKQPDYLKFVFNFILDTFKEFEIKLRQEGRSHVVKATIEEYKTLVKGNFELEKWAQAAHVPTFEKYIEVAVVGVGVCTTLAGIFMCMGKKEDYEWLKSRPKLVRSLCIKGRLMNDINGYEDDMSRGYVTNGINCYMKQNGVTKEEAFRALNKMVVDADKTINEELLMKTGVSRLVLKAVIGVARMITISYNGYEGYTSPEGKIKEYMTSMFIDHIHL